MFAFPALAVCHWPVRYRARYLGGDDQVMARVAAGMQSASGARTSRPARGTTSAAQRFARAGLEERRHSLRSDV